MGEQIRKRPFLSLSAVSIVLLAVFVTTCKFSFAEDKRPNRGTIDFGAESKPTVKTSPHFESFKTMFADIAEEVIPSVVSITSTKIDTVIRRDPFSQFFWGSPFEEFFGSRRRRMPQQQKPQIIPRSGVGSGVIVSKEGHILTNYHVVGEADEITVETHDDRKFEAKIVGVDSLSDVAVIKITEKVNDLPVAYLGDSDVLRPGDWVMAIGNPFNLSSTVTTGIVSALGRHSGNQISYQDFIQTDAAINPGNSGGALVNIEGEVVGINTMIYTRSGGYMGIGFAIPINMAKRIMEDLIYEGSVSRGWLGVSIQNVDQATADALGLSDRHGVLIPEVFDGQPADKAGMKRGDVVVSIDGKRIEDANDLRNRVAVIRPGETVPITVMRGEKEVRLKVKMGKRDEEQISGLSPSTEDENEHADAGKLLGIQVGALGAELRRQLDVPAKVKGVVVLDVDQTSSARGSLRKNDIIMEVNRYQIRSVKEFKKTVKGLNEGDSVLFLVLREGHTVYVAYKLRK